MDTTFKTRCEDTFKMLSVYNIATNRQFTQDVLAHANGKCTLMGKGKDPSRIGCILGKIRY